MVFSGAWIRRLAPAAGLLLVSGCSATQAPPEGTAGWAVLRERGLGSDVQFAVALTSPRMADSQVGYLALIRRDGSSEFLKTGPHPDGPVVAAPGSAGRVCATSETTTYELTAETATQWKRGGYPGSGHWGAATEKYGCVVVINSGVGEKGYETDVYWGRGNGQRHSLVPVVPGPTGLMAGAIWVREAGVTAIPSELRLYRTDLTTGETAKFLAWPTYSEPNPSGTDRINFDDSYASDLFEHDGRIYYIEDLLAVSGKGERQDIKPGIHAELRLAEIDPSAATYRSDFVEYSKDGIQGGDATVSYASVSALRRGHLNDGVIYTGDTRGNIIAVEIETRKVHRAVRLTDEAVGAVDASAAWHGHEVTLFLAGADGNVTQETYDLETGQVIQRRALKGFARLLTAGLDLGNAAER